jgi:hypothetical protein
LKIRNKGNRKTNFIFWNLFFKKEKMEKENLKIKEIEKQTLSFGILKTNRWKNRQIFFFLGQT